MGAHRDSIDAALAARGIVLSGDISRYALKEVVRVVEVMGGRIRFAGGVAASYDTDADQGADAAIVYTAAFEGAGPPLAIQYVAGGTAGAESVALGIGADGAVEVEVTIETGVSTADQVVAALDAEDLSSLVTYANKAGNDGSGVVITMAAKAFTGGADPSFVIAPAS